LVLTPVALQIAGPKSAVLSMGPLLLSRRVIGILALSAVAAAVTCMYTAYFPVLNGHAALDDARYRLARGERFDPLPKILAAAQADGFWPEPWGMLAEIWLSRWQVTGDSEDWDRFVATADTYCNLDPRHHVTWFTRGTWFLTAWKQS